MDMATCRCHLGDRTGDLTISWNGVPGHDRVRVAFVQMGTKLDLMPSDNQAPFDGGQWYSESLGPADPVPGLSGIGLGMNPIPWLEHLVASGGQLRSLRSHGNTIGARTYRVIHVSSTGFPSVAELRVDREHHLQTLQVVESISNRRITTDLQSSSYGPPLHVDGPDGRPVKPARLLPQLPENFGPQLLFTLGR
jgi:hypothetical protein